LTAAVGQADEPEAEFAHLARIDFDLDGDGFDADQGGRTDDGEHPAGQGETRGATIPDVWALILRITAYCWVVCLGNLRAVRLS
jgi:hypothetical protein